MPPLSAALGLAPSPATLTRAGSPASLGGHDDAQLVHESLTGGRREADGRAGAAEPSSWRLPPPCAADRQPGAAVLDTAEREADGRASAAEPSSWRLSPPRWCSAGRRRPVRAALQGRGTTRPHERPSVDGGAVGRRGPRPTRRTRRRADLRPARRRAGLSASVSRPVRGRKATHRTTWGGAHCPPLRSGTGSAAPPPTACAPHSLDGCGGLATRRQRR